MKVLQGAIRAETPGWRERASCLQYDPDIWFENRRVARQICNDCPVFDDCLSDSILDPSRMGIAAALSDNQRAKLRRKLREAA
jgi:hypothetical protein